jgi:hypothetical protein
MDLCLMASSGGRSSGSGSGCTGLSGDLEGALYSIGEQELISMDLCLHGQ